MTTTNLDHDYPGREETKLRGELAGMKAARIEVNALGKPPHRRARATRRADRIVRQAGERARQRARRRVLRSREEVRRHGQRLTTRPTSAPRLRHGRAARPACNSRSRGSRRTASTPSRGDPDDLGDEPPADSRLPIGGRR